jgi:YegS/Rv2252/BmrU family lipid kinase
MRLLFVVNPISGGKNKSLFLESAAELCQRYGIDIRTFNTTGKDDIEQLKNEVSRYTPDRVVSVGGDGTTLMTSRALQGTKIPFGIIPMGSANGMAKELGVPSDAMEAFHDLIISKIIVPLDLIRVNKTHYTIHLGDIGINAAMVENFSKEEGRGWLAYARHFVDAVKNSPQFDVSIEIGEDVYEHKAYSVLIANTRMYGTGAIINPKGNPHDGKFEIVVIKQNDLSGIINLGLTAITEKALEALKGYSDIYQVNKATIRLNEPKVLQLDGEVIGKSDLIETEIVPSGVRYISTNDSSFINTVGIPY